MESVTFAKNVGTFVGTYALSGCKALKAFICPNEVTTLRNYAFAYDYTVPGSDGKDGTGSESKLTTVNMEGGGGSIGDYAFSYCSALEEIVLPAGIEIID